MHATLKPYDFHGVDIKNPDQGDDEAKAICPFCNYERPVFHVNVETGQYHCKHCGDSGNIYTFLQRTLDILFQETSRDAYKDLTEDRPGVPWTMFRDHEFAYRGDDTWLMPVKSPRGSIVNIRTYRYGSRTMGTSGLPLHLWRLETFRAKGPIYICEGEWDALALERLRKKAKKAGIVLAVPGAKVFKNEWSHFFVGRDVYLCFDNDGEGQEGAERTASILQAHARSIRVLHWPPDVEDGWDIRDTVHHELDVAHTQPAEAWKELNRLFRIPSHLISFSEGTPKPELDLPKRTSFRTVLKDYKQCYYLDKNMADALVIMFATALSIRLPGDPIWLFLVGPPGSGKTMLLSSLRLTEWAVFKSSITPKSLISGFITESGDDPSLISKLMGKLLVLKDYTEIIAMNREAQEEIYGILRGAYDGFCEKTFGNGITRSYPECHFSMIAGVTDIIHGNNRAALGERFLKYQLIEGGEVDPSKQILAAISGMANQLESEYKLQRVAAAFLNAFKVEDFSIPSPEPWLLERVVALARVLSHLRATVPRTGRDELIYRPSPEIGTRIAKTLMKLGGCAAMVLGKSRMDKECWGLMKRVAMNTARGWNLDIFREVARHGHPVSRGDVMHNTRIAGTTCTRHLENLKLLGTLECTRLPVDSVGQPPYGWTLSDEMRELWNIVERP